MPVNPMDLSVGERRLWRKAHGITMDFVVAEVERRKALGECIENIVPEYGYRQQAYRRHIRMHGMRKHNKHYRKIQPSEYAEICAEIAGGATSTSLAERYGVNELTIRRIWYKNGGTPLRPRTHGNRYMTAEPIPPGEPQ